MIAIACDHGAYDLKELLKKHMQEQGLEVKDFGCHSLDSCDYPDFGRPAAESVANGECEKGVVLCTTGIGMSIAANKVPGVRCALCADVYSARMTREHNDTNVLAMGAGIVGPNLAIEILDTWLSTPFSELEKHARRINKLENAR